MFQSLYSPGYCRNLVSLTLCSDSWCRRPVRTFFFLPKRLQVSRSAIYVRLIYLINVRLLYCLLFHGVTCYSKCGPQTSILNTIWGLVEMQNLRLYPRLANQNLHLIKIPGWCTCPLKRKQHARKSPHSIVWCHKRSISNSFLT